MRRNGSYFDPIGLGPWLRLCVVLALFCLAGGEAIAHADPSRSGLDASYRQQLEALANRCLELGLTSQAKVTRHWCFPRDTRRHYLFMPEEAEPMEPDPDAPRLVKFWHDRFTSVRKARGAQLHGLARRLVREGRAGEAYRLLHEVLHEDPDHAETRRVLGYRQTANGWHKPFREPRARRALSTHPLFGWQRSRYWRIDSAHFRLTTDADVKAGTDVVEFLERVHAAWRQLFFDYWSPAGRLAARLDGGSGSLGSDHKFRIVLFRDQGEYTRQLSRFESRIAISVGYYSQRKKTAFFFVGEPSTRANLVHEATHQFFQESVPAAAQVGQQSNFWVVEGVALYMESLARHAGYFTTGGEDAERLQYARYRALSEHRVRPVAELVTYGRVRFQQDENIRRLYSQSAGLAHYFMHSEPAHSYRPFVKYLQTVYRRENSPRVLRELMGRDYAKMDQQYLRFLNVTDDELAFVDRRCRKLCLGHTSVTDHGLQRLKKLDQLQWLDLSFTLAGDRGLAVFSDCRELDQLNLEKTRITDQGLAVVSAFRQLEELDLSQTDISDEGLRHLTGLARLKILWLTGTGVTDRGLRWLSSLNKLEQLEVDGTSITAAGLAGLKRQLPKLK